MAFKDPERAREYQREWRRKKRAENPEPDRAANRRSHQKHREERLGAMLEYRTPRRAELAARQAERRISEGWRVARDRNLRYYYGISLEGYEEMVEAQFGQCAICDQKPKRHVLVVDHCHKTGKVRGLLCQNCNIGLGQLRDSIGVLERAIAYLRD